MKLILVLAACLGLGFAAPQVGRTQVTSLIDDITDFIKILPVADIAKIAETHLQSDAAVSALVEYLQSDAWAALRDEVLAKPTSQEFIQYLTDKGIPVADLLAALNAAIAALVPGVDPDENGSLRPVLDEIEAILPIADLIALLNDKLQNSPDFQDLYTTIASEKGKSLVDEVLQMPEAINIQKRLTNAGVKVHEVLVVLYAFFGWGDPPVPPQTQLRALIDDLREILALIPIDQIRPIIQDHLQTDGALSHVIHYAQSNEWRVFVEQVLAKPTSQDLIAYLTSKDIPILDILAQIRETIAGLVPGVKPDNQASLRPILDKIEALIPTEALVALINDKLVNSPDFQDFYTRVGSPKGHALADEVLQMGEAVRIRVHLTHAGVKVEETLNFIYAFFGWGQPPVALSGQLRALIDDLREILALIPIDQIRPIFEDHLQTDGALSHVINYAQSNEWHVFVEHVLAKPTSQDFIAYLTAKDIPILDILAQIRQAIAGLVPGVKPDNQASLRPILDKIEALIPTADLIALINDKLANSPDFQDLYTTIASEKGHALADEVLQMGEAVRIRVHLTHAGVKVEEALNLIYAFFGWGQPPQ